MYRLILDEIRNAEENLKGHNLLGFRISQKDFINLVEFIDPNQSTFIDSFTLHGKVIVRDDMITEGDLLVVFRDDLNDYVKPFIEAGWTPPGPCLRL